MFLVYVTETRLEESLQQELLAAHGHEDSESIKLISAGYRVVENFKGPIDYQPRLLDMLGIGTGYVGLTPGAYYLVFLIENETGEDPQMRAVNACSVPTSHYRLQTEGFTKSLEEVRALARSAS